MEAPDSPSLDTRPIVWFDIDNTLYSASTKLLSNHPIAYFVSLGLEDEKATKLHHRYYTEYGLALRGLVRHHEVDPIDFDRKCDGSLPLEQIIKPDPALRKLFEDIDRSKVRVWALTNAYKPHAERVLRLLNLEDQIDGLVYCDYANREFSCKPEPEYYHQALAKAGITDPSKCYFVDDSLKNLKAAHALGWGHLTEEGIDIVSNLQQLRTVWPEIFKEQ
ncbi:pyrimidine 5-nucleotidase [Schizophyllum commune H4-8]|uniref:Pyrimidine 5-nucleotidase n=1 Tax=Schizophyllum commune (strain H4-8 / FGSC 9210) TaxID=578458 RepID=D8PPW3_SCHCM|nr:pyrimidine 5-nucleotidase [Schizophyllum commune H4-8]KAI5893475.1 pyrimidine 5-nucleotidase [Schizophyllum commune H4-8]